MPEEEPMPEIIVADADSRPSRTLTQVHSPALSQATLTHANEQLKLRDTFMRTILREGHDYGVVPGTRGKPTLFKPGAERLLSAYQLRARLTDDSPPVMDLTGREHDGEAFIQFRRSCTIYWQPDLGSSPIVVAQASGECNSFETKYRYRESKRECPQCGDDTGALLRSKQPPRDDPGAEPGWFCWTKKGGCGANFYADDDRITSQRVGRVPNPNPADLTNTLLKLADKRALVAATIIATGWSDLVTQDLEDRLGVSDEGEDDAASGGVVDPPGRPPTRPARSQAASGGTVQLTTVQSDTVRAITSASNEVRTKVLKDFGYHGQALMVFVGGMDDETIGKVREALGVEASISGNAVA